MLAQISVEFASGEHDDRGDSWVGDALDEDFTADEACGAGEDDLRGIS